jgi:thiol-disulfide isomerase/thioredoxin
MKNSVKWIVGVLALVLVIVGAYLLYNNLKENYTPDSLGKPDGVVDKTEDDSDSTDKENGKDTEDDEEQGESGKYKSPDFTVLDWEGNEVKLSDYVGKPVVLNFWASWCGYCVSEMPAFARACVDNPDVQFLMVNVTDGKEETVEGAKSFIEKYSYPFTVLFDTKLDAAMKYGASSLPITFFINAKGELVVYRPGALNDALLAQGIAMITE